MKNIENEVRTLVKEARIKKNLSQGELAAKLGKTQIYISFLESGKRGITAKAMDEIALVLDIDFVKELCKPSEDVTQVEPINVNEGKIDVQPLVLCEELYEDVSVKRRERKTERAQLLLKPSTKDGIKKYAEENDTSLNDVIQCLIESFLMARARGDILCEYGGVVFNPSANVGMLQKEHKTSRIQLLLKESTKIKIKQLAMEQDTSINDIVQNLADAFLWEIWH